MTVTDSSVDYRRSRAECRCVATHSVTCTICLFNPALTRVVIVDPLVDATVSFVCEECEQVNEAAIATLLARQPHLGVYRQPL